MKQILKVAQKSDVAGDRFGSSMSLSDDGNTAVLGSYQTDSNKGVAYIFVRSGTEWTQQAKLLASDRASSDHFGISVAISADGSTAIVGAYGNSDNGIQSGSAYIFTRSGTTWSQQAKLLASDAAANDYFGYSVAISNDGSTAIIGAYTDDDNDTNSGSVYVFTRSGTVWTQQAKLLASDAAAGDHFGWSVSISADGSTAIVGAVGNSDNGTSSGSVYIFTRSGTTWSQQAKLLASDAAAYDYFGASVAISGDGNTSVIGTYGDDAGKGSAYIFVLSGTEWTEQTKLVSSDREDSDWFGRSVAINGDGNTAIIGAHGADSYKGAVYIFTRSGAEWTEQTKILASDVAAYDYFGQSVSISADGNTAIVGAYENSDDGSNGSISYTFARLTYIA